MIYTEDNCTIRPTLLWVRYNRTKTTDGNGTKGPTLLMIMVQQGQHY